MIVETVTLTHDKITVSYSSDDLSLMTPAMLEKCRVFWAAQMERIVADALGASFLGTSSGNAFARQGVPAREHEAPKAPNPHWAFPFGNIPTA